MTSRDCLAAPGTTFVDGAPPLGLNKNKTCYKCGHEGHVRSPRIVWTGI